MSGQDRENYTDIQDRENYTSEPTNEDRAEWARRALEVFQQAKGEVIEFNEDEVVDLITDLLHCANQQLGISTEDILERAKMHFEVEL